MKRNKLFEAMNPQEQQLVSQVNQALLSTRLFVEMGLAEYNGELRLYGVPRFIFKDMLQDSDILPEQFTYSVVLPKDKYMMEQAEIFTNAQQITMQMLKAYTRGQRELIHTNEPTEIKEVDDAEPASEQTVAPGTGE